MEKAAAVHAARKRHASNGNSDGDLISRLPDAVLGTIISLIPTKDGARTQSISRRWRHLWRFAPLNIEAGIGLCHNVLERASIVSRILSDHPGPARRFYFPFVSLGDDGYAVVDGWFRSPALANLQELDISYDHWQPGYPLPPSALRSTSATLLTAKFGYWGFPDEIAPPLSFPLLKQLTLWSVCISPDAFHGVISGCHALESLLMWEIHIVGPLHVSSATLRGIGFSCARYSRNQELVIEEAPRLKVLLSLHPETFGETIRVIMAPKLEILGPLSPLISKLEIATLVFQEMVPVNLTDSISTVKVLAVSTSGQLNTVLDVLRCFPCLERLVIWHKYLGRDMNNMHRHEYDPLDHIECLENHLKKIVFKNYEGCGQDVDFAKFFLLNAKVLKEMEFGVPKNYNNKWVAVQHRLLQVENRASRDVQFKFRRGFTNSGTHLDIHDLSMVDPFDCMFC